MEGYRDTHARLSQPSDVQEMTGRRVWSRTYRIFAGPRCGPTASVAAMVVCCCEGLHSRIHAHAFSTPFQPTTSWNRCGGSSRGPTGITWLPRKSATGTTFPWRRGGQGLEREKAISCSTMMATQALSPLASRLSTAAAAPIGTYYLSLLLSRCSGADS
jgi:hypothetical protein